MAARVFPGSELITKVETAKGTTTGERILGTTNLDISGEWTIAASSSSAWTRDVAPTWTGGKRTANAGRCLLTWLNAFQT